jgi:hypothetical protein
VPDANVANADIYVRVLNGAPQITSALSRKTHGAAGDFDIALPLSGAAGIEPRKNGPTKIVVSFDEDIYAADGTPSTNEVSLSSGAVSSVSISGSTLTANIVSVLDQTCLTMTLNGLVDIEGNPLAYTNQVRAVVLAGDVDGNNAVNIGDMLLDKSKIGLLVDPSTFIFDVDASGAINVGDMLIVKSMIGHAVACP